jgi:thioredoxin
MKRTSLVVLSVVIMVFSAVACTNANSGNDKNGSENKSGNVSLAGNPAGDDSKPEFLTAETFKKKIWNYETNPDNWVYEGKEPAIIDFYADWCKPCKMVAPILDEISKDYAGKIKVYKIDTQKEKELAAVFQVSSIPTFLYIPADGKPQMDRGFKEKEAFERIIKEVLMIK